ncbi:hypothetical protein K9L27_04390 [Candidatus Gracilibacteria bacterium]|nr:hypothetical protein [Candidatus Gracilibacteria bacterium]
MFDKIFEFIKKLISPVDKIDTLEQKKPKIVDQTKNIPIPVSVSTENIVVPSVNQQSPRKASSVALAETKISLEEQRHLLEERRRIPGWILFLKYLSLVLTVGGLLGFVWLQADLDSSNRFLSLFNLQENIGLKFDSLNRRQKLLEEENKTFDSKIRQIDTQLETEKYSMYTDTIQKIRSEQLLWFDQTDSTGIIQYGIINSIQRMQEYFNSRTFDHSILTGSGNSLEIENIWVSRDYASFSATGSNLFGKVFFLNTEFVKMINSFPIFRGGEIRSFSKKKDRDGKDTMSFSIKLSIQKKDEKDGDDEYFSRYQKWLSSYPSLTTTNISDPPLPTTVISPGIAPSSSNQ